MKNILIVEDEIIIAISNKILLEELGYNVLNITTDWNEIQHTILNNVVDLVLLDINLENELMNGIDIGRKLTELRIPFIFTTSYSDPDTVHKAIDTNPEGYLIKPLNKTSIYTQLEITFRKLAQNFITINDSGKTYILNTKNIIYLQAEGNYTNIFTIESKIVVRSSLVKLTALFPPFFKKPHKSYLVNEHFILKIKEDIICCSNNIHIPLSRHYKNNFIK